MSMRVISAMTGNPPLDKQRLLHYTLLHYEHASNFCHDRKSAFRETNIAVLYFATSYSYVSYSNYVCFFFFFQISDMEEKEQNLRELSGILMFYQSFRNSKITVYVECRRSAYHVLKSDSKVSALNREKKCGFSTMNQILVVQISI